MSFPLALMLSALTGLVALCYEIVWYRVWSFASGGAAQSFAALLGFYLLGVALGSLASGRLCRARGAGDRSLLRAMGLLVLLATAASFLVIPLFAAVVQRVRWSAGLPLVVAATALQGALFPLLSHAAVAPDPRAGPRVAVLYLGNIAGAAAGSLLTGFVLMEIWPLPRIALGLALGGVALAAGVLLLTRPSRREAVACAGGLVLAAGTILGVGPALYHDLYEKLLFKDAYAPARRFAAVVENRSGVITVTSDGVVFGGGVYDGVFSTDLRQDRNGIIRAYALAALRPASRDVLMIGLASGSWARVVAANPEVGRLTVVEINRGYLALLPRFPGGAALLADPRVEVVIDDGRRWLSRHPEARFDAVVQNTTWHWRAHVTNLLSREYLELVRAHLRPGGVFYFNTTHAPEAQKTAAEVYPHALRVQSFVAASDAPLALERRRWRDKLLATRIDGLPVLDPGLPADRARLEQVLSLCDTVDRAGDREGLETRAHMLARLAGARVITDDNMATEW